MLSVLVILIVDDMMTVSGVSVLGVGTAGWWSGYWLGHTCQHYSSLEFNITAGELNQVCDIELETTSQALLVCW